METSTPNPTFWRKCSACKRPIGFSQKYQVCSVSTCTRKRSGFVFCSVPCWASHVPTFRHRDAWAIEQVSPTLQQYLNELKNEEMSAPAKTVTEVASSSSNSNTEIKKVPMTSTAPSEEEVLVVVSKLKAYIKAKGDMNTSGDVMDVLSDRLRRLCDEAIRHARQDGRKTVMARDFVASSEG